MLLPVCEVGLRCAVALGHVDRMHRTSRVLWSQKCEETGLKGTSSRFFLAVAGSSFQASELLVVVPVVTRSRCSDDTHPAVSEGKNNMRSLTSDSVHGFNVALQTAHELPLNFTARRHGIASFLCVASQVASLDAPIRCALVLHPDFPVELKTNSKCNGHIAFLPISSVRFMLV